MKLFVNKKNFNNRLKRLKNYTIPILIAQIIKQKVLIKNYK